jgi:small subunit ribosomal protein S16
VAVKIKLKRLGKIRAPYYRIIIADARTKRDGRAIEEIGKYHPKAEPSLIEVDSERAQHWLSVGAQPTDPVRKILEVTGDWQKFKGLPGAEGTLRTAEPKDDRKAVFAAAVAETLVDSGAKPKARGKAADAKALDAKSSDARSSDARSSDARTGGKSERAPARGKRAATADAAATAEAAETPAAEAETAAVEAETPAAEVETPAAEAETAPADTAPADAAPADTATAESGAADQTEGSGA